MNRWIVPGVAVVVVAGAVVAGPQIPVAEPPVAVASVDAARVSLVCPVEASEGVTQVLAAASSSQPVRLAVLGEPDGADQQDLATVVTNPAAWTRVAALATDSFGGMTWLTAPETAERGMSGAPCLAPSTEQWFTGVELTANTQASIMLANLDSTDAMADVTIWTADGPAQAAGLGGIKVIAGQTTEVPLNVKLTTVEPVAVRVATSKGRLVAYLRQHLWQGAQPRGGDWIPEGGSPASKLVIPGIPAGTGTRTLVIANAGQDPVIVQAEMLGLEGVSSPPGLEAIAVNGQSVVTVDAAAPLADQAGSLRLTSTGAITAGIILSSDGTGAASDPAYLAAAAPLDSDGLWPFPVPATTALTLQLVNAGDAPQTAIVTATTAPGVAGKQTNVALPAGTTVTVKLPKTDMRVLHIQTTATDVYGVVLATGQIGTISGLAAVPLVSFETPRDTTGITNDPRVGVP